MAAAGLPHSTVWSNLDQLTVVGQLESRRDGRSVRYYPSVPKPALGTEPPLSHIIPQSGMTLPEMTRHLGVPRLRIRTQLSKLIADGRIIRRGLHRPRYFLAPN